jgi:hypothetical protein
MRLHCSIHTLKYNDYITTTKHISKFKYNKWKKFGLISILRYLIILKIFHHHKLWVNNIFNFILNYFNNYILMFLFVVFRIIIVINFKKILFFFIYIMLIYVDNYGLGLLVT